MRVTKILKENLNLKQANNLQKILNLKKVEIIKQFDNLLIQKIVANGMTSFSHG